MTEVARRSIGPVTLRVRRLQYDAFDPRPREVGWDLMACLISETGVSRQIVLPPRESRMVPTGVSIKPPRGHYCLIVSLREPAKGHNAIWVTDAPQVLMPDYDGEVSVLLYNGGISSHYIAHGQPIGHLLVASRPDISMVVVP